MTSMDSTRPEHYTPADLVYAQVRARRLSAISNIVLGLVVLGLVVIVGLNVKGSGDRADAAQRSADANGELIADLAAELARTRALLTASDKMAEQISDCDAVLSAASRDANRAYFGQVGRLVVIIATVVPSERDAAIGTAITDINTALDTYTAAADTFSAWAILPPELQLPCPA